MPKLRHPAGRSTVRRVALGATVMAVASIAPFASALAADDDGGSGEAYPPAATIAPADPGDPGQIPATGNDGTDTWLKLGAGAVLAGGVLVTAAARRRGATAPA